ncbi:MAG: hypothetical protein GY845_15155 [Planctomycetes bacterium]|nr:hypothetical protein [Planctomycetota bacterium]
MNEKDCFRIACCFVVLFSVSVMVACQKTIVPDTHSKKSFQIHLISLSQIADLSQADEEPDILNEPQYIISDEQIKSYDWSQQLIAFDDTVQDMYVNDVNFLSWPSSFAIVWDGKIVVEGEILDTASPVLTTYPVVYVLEPKGDPQFPTSSYRTIGSIIPDPSLIKDLSILLRADQGQMFQFEHNVTDLVFDDSVAEEVKEHFRQDGRLID